MIRIREWKIGESWDAILIHEEGVSVHFDWIGWVPQPAKSWVPLSYVEEAKTVYGQID